MGRASAGVRFRPFSRTIRLIASSQLSGVARSQEIRDRLPFSSFLWQVPHFSTTSGLLTGMPSSGFSAGVAVTAVPPRPPRPPSCAGTMGAVNAAVIPTNTRTFRFTGIPPAFGCFLLYSEHGPGGDARIAPAARLDAGVTALDSSESGCNNRGHCTVITAVLLTPPAVAV